MRFDNYDLETLKEAYEILNVDEDYYNGCTCVSCKLKRLIEKVEEGINCN